MVYTARATFRVPTSTLQRPKKQGGWGLIDIPAKCRDLLLSPMWLQSTRVGTATATWLRAWDLAGRKENPPQAGRIPKKLVYLQLYARNMASIPPPVQEEKSRTFRRRVYDTLHVMAVAERGSREMIFIQNRPTMNWTRVWHNLHTSWVWETIKSNWFTVIHEIIPTNESLSAIRLVDTDLCSQCERPDTLIHRLTECNRRANISKWTQARIATLFRTDPRYIHADWTFRSHFHVWPP